MNWSRCIEVLAQTAQETALLKEDTAHSKDKETGDSAGCIGTREENKKRLRSPPYKSGVERALELTSEKNWDDTNTEKEEKAIGQASW